MNGRDTLLPRGFQCSYFWCMVFLLTTSFPGSRGGTRRAGQGTAQPAAPLRAAGHHRWRRLVRSSRLLTARPGTRCTTALPSPQHGSTRALLAPGSSSSHGGPAPLHSPACCARHSHISGCFSPLGLGQPACPLPRMLGLGEAFWMSAVSPSMDTEGLSSPEEKHLKMLLALHILFPHSAW